MPNDHSGFVSACRHKCLLFEFGVFFFHILQNKKGNFFFTTMSKSVLFQDATILRNLGNRSPQAKLKIFLKP